MPLDIPVLVIYVLAMSSCFQKKKENKLRGSILNTGTLNLHLEADREVLHLGKLGLYPAFLVASGNCYAT